MKEFDYLPQFVDFVKFDSTHDARHHVDGNHVIHVHHDCNYYDVSVGFDHYDTHDGYDHCKRYYLNELVYRGNIWASFI